MKVKIQKWDNSAAIRLLSTIMARLNTKIGDLIEVEPSMGKLTLSPLTKPKYKLEDLLAQMSDGFSTIEEWENMPPVGNEILK